jgi:ABC-2 type transport system permease protein
MNPLLAFQLRRIGRNRQYLLFTILLPALFTVFFTKIFGGLATGPAGYQREAVQYMISMMAYGAIGAALGATIRISFDRSSGWQRQLRVTPVSQANVFAVDVAVGALLALPSLVTVALIGRFINDVQLGLGTWIALVGVLWAGSIAFVALGLLIGLSLEERAAGGAIGSVGVVLALLGGLMAPVEVFPESLRTVAHTMPSYWYAELGRDIAAGAPPSGQAVLVVAAFTAAFAALTALVVRRRPMHAVSG